VFPFAGSAERCDRGEPYHRPRPASQPLPTGAAASIAPGDTDLMTPELETPPPQEGGGGEAHAHGGSWVRPVALVASCLVIGFVGGWVFRGDDGPVTVLAPAAPVDSGDTGAVTTGGTSTAPGATTDTTGTATTAPAEPTPPPDRADITLVVLNGTTVSGLAARTAGQAESLGYSGVATGNAPTSTGPSIAYFAPGRRPAAQRVAKDLEIASVKALPGSGALADAAPAGTDVVLVLGPG